MIDDVTHILLQIDSGDPSAAEQLLPLVYEELRRLARHRLANEAPGNTLDSAALVHEAYLRLVDVADARPWEGRRHFFGAAAEAMRRILVDRARKRKALKRGGQWRRVEIDDADFTAGNLSSELLALNEALGKFEQKEPLKAELVKLRFFAGLTNSQAALALGISESTADNYWAYARSWLRLELSPDRPVDSDG